MLRSIVILGVALAIGLVSGCKDKSAPAVGSDAEAMAIAQKVPDGTNVLAALDQKDYEGAVAAVAKIQQSLPEAEQQEDFALLKQHVKGKLIDASATDPKAAEALNSLRFLTQGR